MLKRIATIFAGSVAHGAGTIVGARAGHDAYNWVKQGGAKRTVKRIAGSMADAASAVLPQKEVPALRGVSSITEAADEEEFVDVPCERCKRPSAVLLGSGDIVVTCAKCKARFWVDTDELARKRELT